MIASELNVVLVCIGLFYLAGAIGCGIVWFHHPVGRLTKCLPVVLWPLVFFFIERNRRRQRLIEEKRQKEMLRDLQAELERNLEIAHILNSHLNGQDR